MTIYSGPDKIKQIKLGSTLIKKVYVGSDLVFTSDYDAMTGLSWDYNVIKSAMEAVNAGKTTVMNGVTFTISSDGSTLTDNAGGGSFSKSGYTLYWVAHDGTTIYCRAKSRIYQIFSLAWPGYHQNGYVSGTGTA